MVGGDGIPKHREDTRTMNVLDRIRRSLHSIEERRQADIS